MTEVDVRLIEPVLFRFAVRATRDPEVARDLTQDALLAAVAQAPQFACRSSLKTWVLGILVHKVQDHFRARQMEPLEGDEDPALLDTASAADVDRVVMARQELDRVKVALGLLPVRERLALLLTDVEGLDRDEVCSVLVVTPTHLRTLLHRGRNRLRRILERD